MSTGRGGGLRRAGGGSHRVVIAAPPALARFIAPKGSIAVDGVSLTVNEVEGARFGVNIIPHTWSETTLGGLQPGDRVHIEIDMLARYVARGRRGTMKTALLSDYLSSTADLIEEARAGRMFILVDDEDRENEGDLVIPAQFATPDAINFMARHARGLICLAMTRQRVEQLGLPLMSQSNGTRHQTAFTVSIEARGRGDHRHLGRRPRAHHRGGDQPGDHARRHRDPRPRLPADGARRRRAGARRAYRGGGRHRPAGRAQPAGVICEIMNDDGTMARLPDLVAFAQRHNLKLGTIADLIATAAAPSAWSAGCRKARCTTPPAANGSCPSTPPRSTMPSTWC